jgi:hypothetical protein
MIFGGTIALTPSNLEPIINGLSPYTATFDVSQAVTDKKVYKIKYFFDDGSPVLEKKLIGMPAAADSSLFWPSEPGDPRNHPVSKTFTVLDTPEKTFNITVKLYYVGDPGNFIPNEKTYKIALKLRAPTLDAESAKTNSEVFNDIHLLSVSMFGPEDTMMYVFQSINPTYCLPVVAKWKEGISNIPADVLESINYRPYQLSPNFIKTQ